MFNIIIVGIIMHVHVLYVQEFYNSEKKKNKKTIVASTERENTEYGHCNYSGGVATVKADCQTIYIFLIPCQISGYIMVCPF